MKIWAEKATKTFSTLLMIKHILWNDFDYVTIGVFLLQIWLRWFWLCHSYWFCEFDKADDQSRLLQHHICQIWFYQYSYDYIISFISNHIILSSYKRSFEKDPTYFFGSWLLIPYKMKSTYKEISYEWF